MKRFSAEERKWYYVGANKQQQAATPPQLRELVRTGGVTGSTLVWAKGEAGWVALEKVPSLKSMLAMRHESRPPPQDATRLREVARKEAERAEAERCVGVQQLDCYGRGLCDTHPHNHNHSYSPAHPHRSPPPLASTHPDPHPRPLHPPVGVMSSPSTLIISCLCSSRTRRVSCRATHVESHVPLATCDTSQESCHAAGLQRRGRIAKLLLLQKR